MKLKPFKYSYLLRGVVKDFAIGRRSNLRFAIESLSLNFCKLNDKGPEPFEYLEFAKADIKQGDLKGAINGLGNAKRAIHLTIKNILLAWGLLPSYKDENFPTQLQIFQELNAFPTKTLEALNRKRNIVEHEFTSVEITEVEELIDIAEMFLLIAYPFLRSVVVGGFVGILDDDKCYEWRISSNEGNVQIFLIQDAQYLDTEIGRIYFDFGEMKKGTPEKQIEIIKSNKSEWINYLDLLVYMTKKKTTMLEKQTFPEVNYHHSIPRQVFLVELPEE